MGVLPNLIYIILGFVLLIKGADYLVNGASSLAKKLRISELAIGLTIVAMGTSAPEMVVNVYSSYQGLSDVVFGNIIGSNIFNLFLIMGVAGMIYPITVQRNSAWIEIPYSFLITLILIVMLNDVAIFGAEQNGLSLTEGIILLVFFGIFLLYVFKNMQKAGEIGDVEEVEILPTNKMILMIGGGVIGLGIGGALIVENAVVVAEEFEVSKKLIGLTLLAAGTSLPELATTAVASFQKKSDIAVGNIIGSNIFNILLVLALSAIVNPMPYNDVLNTDVAIILLGTLMLFIFNFTIKRYRLDRVESGLYLLGFFIYMFFLFYREQQVLF